MIAVYSDYVFGDRTLYAEAEAAHRRCDVTLLTALDLPWRADGHQRDGPHVREPVDAMVRAALQRAGGSYAVVTGAGDARLAAALRAVRHALECPRPADAPLANATWQRACQRCGDGTCERHLFPRP